MVISYAAQQRGLHLRAFSINNIRDLKFPEHRNFPLSIEKNNRERKLKRAVR